MDADAIVIGAGAAGLAAARSLVGRSLRVIVLEARDRVGGRVLTGPASRGGIPAELGAEFIHGPAPETRALLRAAGTADVETGGDSWACGPDGVLRPAADFSSAMDILDGARELATDMSVEQYLQRFRGDETMRDAADLVRLFVQGFDAADPAIASVRGIADEWNSGVDSISARPLGGYTPMFEQLAGACDALGVDRRLSTVVKRIAWRRGAVDIEAANANGESQIFRARTAVVTLPVGVLRHTGETAVFFDPELPSAKRGALAYIEMGHAVKVALRFRTAFWETLHGGRYREAGFFRCAGPFTAYWTQMPVHGELIAAWAGGPKAIALECGFAGRKYRTRARRLRRAIRRGCARPRRIRRRNHARLEP